MVLTRSEEATSGPSSAVRAYITQEYTSQGYHCRSENVSQGIFEVVLPQVAPGFSLFMADLLDCGVSSVDFRADAHECRLIVCVDEAAEIPAFVKSSIGMRKWCNYLLFVVVAFIFLVAGLALSKYTGLATLHKDL